MDGTGDASRNGKARVLLEGNNAERSDRHKIGEWGQMVGCNEIRGLTTRR